MPPPPCENGKQRRKGEEGGREGEGGRECAVAGAGGRRRWGGGSTESVCTCAIPSFHLFRLIKKERNGTVCFNFFFPNGVLPAMYILSRVLHLSELPYLRTTISLIPHPARPRPSAPPTLCASLERVPVLRCTKRIAIPLDAQHF